MQEGYRNLRSWVERFNNQIGVMATAGGKFVDDRCASVILDECTSRIAMIDLDRDLPIHTHFAKGIVDEETHRGIAREGNQRLITQHCGPDDFPITQRIVLVKNTNQMSGCKSSRLNQRMVGWSQSKREILLLCRDLLDNRSITPQLEIYFNPGKIAHHRGNSGWHDRLSDAGTCHYAQ